MTTTTIPSWRRSDDLDAVLSVPRTDPASLLHAVADNADTVFTWDYRLVRPQLRKLYEKAKDGQWNASTDIAWSTDVDVEATVVADRALSGFTETMLAGTPAERWGQADWVQFGVENRRWMLSQFLHGEQGALLTTAKITQTVPWHDAKLYAATQVIDEARHVEVFARYIDDKLGGAYSVDAHLRMLLDDVIADSRWDMTYLGMQVLVEGLALAAFGFMHQMTAEPLLKQLLRLVMSDEARHVAFGVLSLNEAYEAMSDAEMFERQQFAYEASLRMRDRFFPFEVWETMGVDPKVMGRALANDPTRVLFQRMLFSKVVPNLRKLGLLDRNDGWLRERFAEMGVLGFAGLAGPADDPTVDEIFALTVL